MHSKLYHSVFSKYFEEGVECMLSKSKVNKILSGPLKGNNTGFILLSKRNVSKIIIGPLKRNYTSINFEDKKVKLD